MKSRFLIFLALLVFVALLSLYSCSEKHDDPEILPNQYSLEYKSLQILEFSKTNKQGTESLLVEEVSKYFGDRVQFSCPSELQFSEDSIKIVKLDGVLHEGYKIKWQESNLFLYDDVVKEWKLVGKKDTNSRFTLHVGFYLQSGNNENSSLTAIGQGYGLISSPEFSPDSNTSLVVWLKVDYVFE